MKNTPLNPNISIFFIIITLTFSCFSFSNSLPSNKKTSIVFAVLGKLRYNFDVYTVPITTTKSQPSDYIINAHGEVKITDGVSVNYNGHFPANSTAIFSLLNLDDTPVDHSTDILSTQLLYVTERDGVSSIYFDSVTPPSHDSVSQLGQSHDSLSQIGPSRMQVPLLVGDGKVLMKDRPSLVGDHLIYVSTHENSTVPRTSWAAVYSTHLPTGSTRRLTPYGVADFSPAVSPSGKWTAVASDGKRGWDGEVEELGTNIYIFLTQDGSSRVKIVEHGGWPSWVDENTVFFHRRDDSDGWWSVYKASLPRVGRVSVDSVRVERVTLPGLHAFTPATSPGNYEFIALATKRPGSDFRHIELFNLVKKEFIEVTRPISPEAHHLNPFLFLDSSRVGYHRCRGSGNKILLESIKSPEPVLSMFRMDGQFPSFSPKGDRIAYLDLSVDTAGVFVVDSDGLNRRLVLKGLTFSTAWDPIREGVIYTSLGPNFASESTKVDIISINVDEEKPSYKKLTHGGENNAFPSPSPDGKWIVFRSGRTGHKNLYIMDAEEGELGGVYRLTEGPWSDTMANWSPDGEWIAFSSDRENPGGGSFEIYMIHPNRTGLHKVIQSGIGGRANHPWFSPDGKSIVFTSDYAAVSAEPISLPHHYQPYGDIFIAKTDGSGIRRVTHNAYEEGTPTWGPKYLSPESLAQPEDERVCGYEDCHWLNISPKLPNKITYNSNNDQCRRNQVVQKMDDRNSWTL